LGVTVLYTVWIQGGGHSRCINLRNKRLEFFQRQKA
jgi:hypothetical protein